MVKTGQIQHVASIQYAPTPIRTIHNVYPAHRLKAPLLPLLKAQQPQPQPLVQQRQLQLQVQQLQPQPQPKAQQALPVQ